MIGVFIIFYRSNCLFVCSLYKFVKIVFESIQKYIVMLLPTNSKCAKVIHLCPLSVTHDNLSPCHPDQKSEYGVIVYLL